MAKTRVNVSLDQDLADFVKAFAVENRLTVADVFTQYVLALRRRVLGDPNELLLTHPAFAQALKDVQEKLKTGKARWHSFGEVFGD